MFTEREKLEKKWSHLLTINERQAWNTYALFCPGSDWLSKDHKINGKEMFVLCNLPKRN